MTDNTWTDGTGNHQASDPANWSSGQTPAPGDFLILPTGSTIDIRDNDLQGDTLNIFGGVGEPTTNVHLSHHADARLGFGDERTVVTVQGVDTLQTQSLGGTVHLLPHAHLLGTLNQVGSGTRLTFVGDEGARYINNGNSTLTGADVIMDVPVVGSGTFNVGPIGGISNVHGSSLEFGGFVSSGQTVQVSGGSKANVAESTVQMDQPREFHGTVDLFRLGVADLVGLSQADHWSYKNDMLSIYNGCGSVVDKLHVVSDAFGSSVHGLSVSTTTAGDVLVRPGTDFSGSLVVPTT